MDGLEGEEVLGMKRVQRVGRNLGVSKSRSDRRMDPSVSLRCKAMRVESDWSGERVSRKWPPPIRPATQLEGRRIRRQAWTNLIMGNRTPLTCKLANHLE